MFFYAFAQITVCVLSLLLFTPYASSAIEPYDIDRLIAQARTAADYGAIATYYEHRAQVARHRQRHHEVAHTHAKKRRTGPVKRSGAMALHEASRTHAKRDAQKYEALARYYREKEKNAQ